MGSMQCNVEFGTNSEFALGPRKTTENLDQVGRSQDLLDANWLLASSLALNPQALTLVPICAVVYFFCSPPPPHLLTICFLQLLLWAYDLDKQQTMYNTCGRNKCIYMNKYAYKYISVSVILWSSLNLGVYCSLEKSDVLRGLLPIH
jgi:hypothetical protein